MLQCFNLLGVGRESLTAFNALGLGLGLGSGSGLALGNLQVLTVEIEPSPNTPPNPPHVWPTPLEPLLGLTLTLTRSPRRGPRIGHTAPDSNPNLRIPYLRHAGVSYVPSIIQVYVAKDDETPKEIALKLLVTPKVTLTLTLTSSCS